MRKDKDWALKRIKKCLALYSKASGNEADTAMRQAISLMQQYSISETEVQLSDVQESHVTIGKARGNPPQWQASLAAICAQAFNCRLIFCKDLEFNNSTIIQVKKVCFIGVDMDAELASYTFTVLQRQLKVDRKNYLKSLSPLCNLTTRRRRADLFADNWVKAIFSLIHEFAKNQSHLTMVDAYITEYYETEPIEFSAKTKNKRYDCAKQAGYSAGKNVKIHRPMTKDNNEQLCLGMEG